MNDNQGWGSEYRTLPPGYGRSGRALLAMMLSLFSFLVIIALLAPFFIMFIVVRWDAGSSALWAFFVIAEFVGLAGLVTMAAAMLYARSEIKGDQVRVSAVLGARRVVTGSCIAMLTTAIITTIFGIMLLSPVISMAIALPLCCASMGVLMSRFQFSAIIKATQKTQAPSSWPSGGQHFPGQPHPPPPQGSTYPQQPPAPYRPGGPGWPQG